VRIFIDESGSFAATPGPHSASVVGALIVPDGCHARILKKYVGIRSSLPTLKGEVKGRLLSEADIDRVVLMLAKNEPATACPVGRGGEQQPHMHTKDMTVEIWGMARS
jgi:hypothetical protein